MAVDHHGSIFVSDEKRGVVAGRGREGRSYYPVERDDYISQLLEVPLVPLTLKVGAREARILYAEYFDSYTCWSLNHCA